MPRTFSRSKGLKVLCLEAGRMIEPHKDFHNHKLPYRWPYRGDGKPGQYGELPQGMEWKINEWTDQLFTIPQEDPYALGPGAKFTWTRLRAVGGRTLVWGRESGRFGPLDFKPKSMQDGFGEDWPFTYEDLAPYYDKTEALIGVSGGGEEIFNSPASKNALPRVQGALRGVASQKRRGEDGPESGVDAAGGAQQALRQQAGLPLLRRVQLRMRHRVALQHAGSAVPQDAEDEKFHAAPKCRGAPGVDGQKFRKGSRRFIYRYDK